MVSDWNFLPRFLFLSRRSDSSSGSQQCHSEGNELSLGCGGHWWLDLSASFLFLPLSTKPPWFCSYSDKEIGRTLSLCRGMQCMAKEVLSFFSVLLCAYVITKAGLSTEQWVQGAQQADGQPPGRDYSELRCCLAAGLFMSGSTSCRERCGLANRVV